MRAPINLSGRWICPKDVSAIEPKYGTDCRLHLRGGTTIYIPDLTPKDAAQALAEGTRLLTGDAQ